jgi:hypothetical protein
MNKDFIMGTILVTLIAVSVFSISEINAAYSHVSALYETAVCVYLNGEQVGECSHNTVQNIGLNWTIATISQVAVASGNMSIIALGNHTTAETATLTFLNNTATNAAIPDCGMTPVAGTVAWVGTGNISITHEWTDSNCADLVVNTTALYNQTANGTALTMFAGKNFANSVTLQNGDKLNVTWYVWVASG